MKKIPLPKIWPSEYVATMTQNLGLSLTSQQRQAYVQAVEMVIEGGGTCLDLCRLHAVLTIAEPKAGQSVAGVYRAGVVFCPRTGEVKSFPRATAIPQLMFSFKRAYQAALTNRLCLDDNQREVQAWMVAAGGRCLHPFVIGNTRLFHLVENHIRQVMGFGWTTCVRPKEDFHTFRGIYQQQHAEFYDSKPGAS